ncbi:MAG TPA: phage Gp37/Gp68 family protein [Pyrinomonadaceae bacterium]|nr:phage Gp37/Gp68 family protein [Pyrinomonadaceae bacterium]
MAQLSSIEWTDATWNPVTGCSKISPGCKHCYAERMAKRLQSMGQPRYRDGFKLTLQPDVIEQPLAWKKPRLVFVNSMSDLFHDDVPLSYLKKVFQVMVEARWHIFQVLTKRSERLAEIANRLVWPSNVWMGVSVESEDYTYRIDDLSGIPAAVRFLSVEPLLGPINRLSLRNIDWVIVGGESGPHARPINPNWVRSIRNDCVSAGVPFFFKQWGGTRKSTTGRVLDGRTWDELPRPIPAQE